MSRGTRAIFRADRAGAKCSGYVAVSLLVLLLGQRTPLAPVAGEYYLGDGLGVNWSLILESSGRFQFSWHGCLGLYAELEGRAVLQNGAVSLEPDRPLSGDFASRVPLKLRVVRWGGRIYLIPPDKIHEFENAVNLTQEPRRELHGRFFLRRDDVGREASGDPLLPERGLLLPAPISGRIKRVFASGAAEVNLGSTLGVIPGQELWVAAPDGQGAIGTVTSVAPESSVLTPGEYGIPFAKGYRVSGRTPSE